MHAVDRVTLELIAMALARSKLDLGLATPVAGINAVADSLVFQLVSGESVQVAVFENERTYHLLFPGGTEASFEKSWLASRAH